MCVASLQEKWIKNVNELKFKGRTSLMTVHNILQDYYRSTIVIIYKPKNICSGGGEEEGEEMKEEVVWVRREENSQFAEILIKESQAFKGVKKIFTISMYTKYKEAKQLA